MSALEDARTTPIQEQSLLQLKNTLKAAEARKSASAAYYEERISRGTVSVESQQASAARGQADIDEVQKRREEVASTKLKSLPAIWRGRMDRKKIKSDTDAIAFKKAYETVVKYKDEPLDYTTFTDPQLEAAVKQANAKIENSRTAVKTAKTAERRGEMYGHMVDVEKSKEKVVNEIRARKTNSLQP